MSILINGTTESLQVVLDAAPATNQLPCTASWADQNGAGGDNTVNTNGTTAVTMVTAPGASVVRVISGIAIPNRDTATRIVTVNKVVSGTPFQLIKVTLPVGFQLYYDNSIGWKVLDAAGNRLTTLNAPGRLLGVQVFTATGPYNSTNGTTFVIPLVVGGGGGSGGCAACSAGQAAASGGGAGAGAARSLITSGFNGVTVTVGAGGAAGTAGANAGGTGGTTSFGAFVSATGGGGGGGDNAHASTIVTNGAATGGVGSGGTIFNMAGESGSVAFVLNTSSAIAGSGGSSLLGGGGAQRASLSGIIAGATGGNYGGGASGTAAVGSTAAAAGAVGGQGICIVEEYA